MHSLSVPEPHLFDQDRLMHAVMDNASNGLIIMNPYSRCVYMNPAAGQIIGLTLDEVKTLDKPLHDIVHHTTPEGGPYPIEDCPNYIALRQNKRYQGEDIFVRPDGTFYPVSLSATRIMEDGQLLGTVVEIRDITEEKRSQQALIESEERYRRLVNLSPDAIAVHAGGKLVFINEAGARLMGASSADELIGQPLMQFVHPDYRELVIERIKKISVTNKPTEMVEEKFVRLDGGIIDMEVISIPSSDKGAFAIQVVARDITARKQAEAAIKESEERLRFMAESMPQKVFTAKPDGSVDYLNPQWFDYTGLPLTDIQDWGWKTFIHPDDLEENIARWKHSIDTGEPFNFENRFRRHDGEYRWHISRAHAMHDNQGNIIKWFGSNTDIHDLKLGMQREHRLELQNSHLAEQRKQLITLGKAKDEFISLASHQLRTPATGVKQYLGMVLEGIAGDTAEQQLPYLKQAYESNERQIKIINDLLRVASIDAGKVILHKQRADLVALIKGIIAEQASKFSERQQKVLFEPTPRTIFAVVDAGNMRMVLENIIDNASKYTPTGKAIEVTIGKAKGGVCIRVKDEGVGIAQEDIEKVFQKFTRVDNPLSVQVGGSGLGLYWAEKIIRLHGGTIEIDSEEGVGSTFSVHIPA